MKRPYLFEWDFSGGTNGEPYGTALLLECHGSVRMRSWGSYGPKAGDAFWTGLSPPPEASLAA